MTDAGMAEEAKIEREEFDIGDFVAKKSGSSWRGRVVGYYSTSLTPNGVCVESVFEPGSVQIYPAKALRKGIPETWPPEVVALVRAARDKLWSSSPSKFKRLRAALAPFTTIKETDNG